jgi:hypothetical protein
MTDNSKTLDLSKENLERLFTEATEAANKAGAEWMNQHTNPAFVIVDEFTGQPQGTMLDICGNAHVVSSDKRSGFFRALKKFKFVDERNYCRTLPIVHNYSYRQEYSLQLACARAALKVLQDNGVTSVKIWDYVD